MSTVTSEQIRGADNVVVQCGCLKAGERVAIVCDASTRTVADLIAARAAHHGGDVELVETPMLEMHGVEPSQDAAQAFMRAHLAIGLTAKSLAHTKARREACDHGARYLSLPEYSLALLADPSLNVDYRLEGKRARRVADLFSDGEKVRVVTARGTDMELDIRGRSGNCCPGYVDGPGELGSPPDIEANVSPLEDRSQGRVVVDGSIPHPDIGLLRSPVALEVRDGRIVDMDGEADVIEALRGLLDSTSPDKTRILAECGVGLNSKAELTGVMLTDEGAMGTMHFGFGSNATVGGVVDIPFHLDFVFRDPTLEVDGVKVLDEGRYVL